MAVLRPDLRPEPVAWVVLGALSGLSAGLLVALAGPLPLVALIVAGLALAGAIRAPGVMFAVYLLIPFYKGGDPGLQLARHYGLSGARQRRANSPCLP